ncbi:hypothetical protein TREES_T100005585 [Tupaia chinensis]|uniref:Uncharacterized protein n=1 Tax=Tupaia chinensis TaxID=246437 RepID=L9JII7_TUPCH|nr:hypothetical protein TREES_T100005585 [Tupaia chinensis]
MPRYAPAPGTSRTGTLDSPYPVSASGAGTRRGERHLGGGRGREHVGKIENAGSPPWVLAAAIGCDPGWSRGGALPSAGKLCRFQRLPFV